MKKLIARLTGSRKKESSPKTIILREGVDFYMEDGYMVFTETYHLNRGSCCGSGCRHCPYPDKTTSVETSS